MWEAFDNPLIEALVYTVGAMVLLSVAYLAIVKVRSAVFQPPHRDVGMIDSFQALHQQGELSDEEYRAIKTSLAANRLRQIKGSDEAG